MSEPAKAEDLDGDSLPLQHYSAAGFESVPNTFDDRDDARTPHDTTTARPLLDHTKNGEQSPPTRKNNSRPGYLRDKVRIKPNFAKSFLPGLVRCIISWLLIGAFYISLFRYKDRILSPRTKSGFDTITIALSIAFGLNVASALKAVALDLRWWVLSLEKRTPREVEYILHCDSMTELLRLMFVAPRLRTIFVSLSWLSVNILVQVGIAMLGLTYSASPGIADIYRDASNQNMSVPNMTQFAHSAERFINDNTFMESFATHILGNIGSSYNFSMLPAEPLEGSAFASNPAGFWNATDHWEYHFLDSAPSSGATGAQFLAIYSNRVVKSNATCAVPPYKVAVNDSLAVITLLNENRTVTFPAIAFGVDSIFYLTTPVKDTQTSDGDCGLGCNNVKVLEPAAGPPVPGSFVNGSDPRSFFYDCNITVTSAPEDLPPVRAAQAAQAIALSGQVHPEFAATDNALNQFVAFNLGLPFGEPQNNSASGMASPISRYAIGVVSAAATTNPSMFVPGSSPAQGVRLQFDSFLFFNLILIIIGVLQFSLVLITAVIVKRLVIPEEVLLSNQEAIRKRFVASS